MKIMPSLNLAPLSLLSLWSELEQCYYGDNGYGSDTAELYAYRFQTRSPSAEAYSADTKLGREARDDQARDAALNLYALLETFAGLREVKIEVDGRKLGTWLAKEPFEHRAHVKVIRRKT